MSTANRERIFDDWAMAWTSNDPKELLGLFTDDCVFEDVTFGVVARGKDELRRFAQGAFGAVRAFKYRVTHRFTTQQLAVIEWVMSVAHKADFPGLPATGKHFSSLRGTTIVELEADEVDRESGDWDADTLLKKLGLLPPQSDLASDLQSQTGARPPIVARNTSTNNEAIAIVRRNTEEVQGRGDFVLFDTLFAADFVDHTPQRGFGADQDAVRAVYRGIRTAFPDFHPEIHFQIADGGMVTTYKTYHGTHNGSFMGVAPTGKRVSFDTVDVMRVVDGKIVEHWGVGDLFGLMIQLGVLSPPTPVVMGASED